MRYFLSLHCLLILQLYNVCNAAPSIYSLSINDPTAESYWTEKRLKNASALNSVYIHSSNNPTDTGSLIAPYTSSRLTPDFVKSFYPFITVGKLFFSIPSHGDHFCSGVVANYRIILTAGHCIHSGSKESNGFYNHIVFIPSFGNGNDNAIWPANYVSVSSTWGNGLGKLPNAADFAVLELKDKKFAGDNLYHRIGEFTGILGVQINALANNHATLFGFPANIDEGQALHQTYATSFRLMAPNNVEYGSNMRNGADGGPLIQDFGDFTSNGELRTDTKENKIIGIISYFYADPNIKLLGGSVFDSQFTELYNKACERKINNCT